MAVAITQFEVESHKAFSQCFVLKKTAKKWAKLSDHDNKTTVPAYLTKLAGTLLLPQLYTHPRTFWYLNVMLHPLALLLYCDSNT